MFYPLALSIYVTIIGDSQGGIATPFLRSEGYYVNDYHKDGARIEQTCSKNINLDSQNVIVFLGSNHYGDVSPPNPSCILNMVKNSKQCIWIGPPKIRNQKWKFDNYLKEKVENYCHYISNQEITDLFDGIHTNTAGTRKIIIKIKQKI